MRGLGCGREKRTPRPFAARCLCVHFHGCQQRWIVDRNDPRGQIAGLGTRESMLPPLHAGQIARSSLAESNALTPMVDAKGREPRARAREARKRVCHRANTFQRSARAEFHDRVSGQQHAGAQATWGPPVLGPCQWHRPYRARSRSNRGEPRAREASRRAGAERGRARSSPSSTGPLLARGVGIVGTDGDGGGSDRGPEPSVILYPCACHVVSQRLNVH